jgi:hypothetical protein
MEMEEKAFWVEVERRCHSDEVLLVTCHGSFNPLNLQARTSPA